MHKYFMVFLATVSLCMQCGLAQSASTPGVSPLEMALADAGLFVLQLNSNGDLVEFSEGENPSGRVDDGDPYHHLPPDSDVPYPFTLAFHFLEMDRSGMVLKIIAPNPMYHVRVYKESADAPWQLKEFWKMTDGLRTELPVPPLEAQLKANLDLSKPAIVEPPAADAMPPPRKNLSKIPCPRCKGAEGSMSNCSFCRKQGYIWVVPPSEQK